MCTLRDRHHPVMNYHLYRNKTIWTGERMIINIMQNALTSAMYVMKKTTYSVNTTIGQILKIAGKKTRWRFQITPQSFQNSAHGGQRTGSKTVSTNKKET